VDRLDDDLPGIVGVGTFLVVPGGQNRDTSFQFSLPPEILAREVGANRLTYRLKVQKQPGTVAVPIDICILLPEGAEVLSLSPGLAAQGNELLLSTNLQTDVGLEVMFRLP
jgi:hypothetical protein